MPQFLYPIHTEILSQGSRLSFCLSALNIDLHLYPNLLPQLVRYGINTAPISYPKFLPQYSN